jgi:outer membrane lipoprotein-sorting protein
MKKILFAFLSFLMITSASAQDAKSVIDKMIASVTLGKTYQYTMKQTERINGVLYTNKIFTKVQESPKKVFIDNIEGENKGVQVLYVKGERENKALINKLFGVKLDPFNSLIRKNQHHTILESGFGLLLLTIKDAKARAEAQGQFSTVFKLEGSVTFDGKDCYKLVLTDPTFTYVDYKVVASESLYAISMKKKVCEQLIAEKNGLSFGTVKAGTTLKIPSSYAKKTILYIDKATNHPIYQEMHDDKGLFEKYEFYGLKVNPTFTATDFSEDNPSYNF